MTPFSRNAKHRVLGLDELRALGYGNEAIAHLVRAERIWRVHRGVYALDGPLSPLGRSYAAVRRCEPDAYASRFTAAAVLGLRDHWPERPQVTIVGRTGARGPREIEVHHARTLDVGTCRGVPVTSPAQTVIDCAPLLDAKQLKSLVRRAEHDGLDLTTLTRPGVPRNLRELLQRYVVGSGLTANELEARFFEICAAAGLPRPEIQARLTDRRRIDFVWREIGLIVETDGRRAHDSFVAFADDRARDREHFLRSGFVTLRFTWWDVEHDAGTVGAQVVAAHARLRGDGAS